MKKILIGTIVGAIILFGWQSMSWTGLGIHNDSFKFAPAQDSVISSLEKNLPEPGMYRIPNWVPGSSQLEQDALMKKMEGRPWAIVTYHNYYDGDMFKPIIRGFLICLVCVLLVCLVINQFAKPNFINVFLTAVGFGLVSFLSVSYIGHNWFNTPWHYLTGELIDSIVGWGLCGIWLGLWNNRR